MKEQNLESTLKHLSWGNKQFLSRPSSRPLKWIFVGLITFIIAFFGLACVFTVELSIDSKGHVVSSTPIKEYFEPDATFLEVKVVSGQIVEEGDLLARYSSNDQLREIHSPFRGRVLKVAEKKMMEKANRPWIELAPLDQNIHIVSYVPQSSLSKIELGAKAYIELGTVSKSTHGYFNGKVQSIELKPTEDRNPASTPTYKVTLLIDPEKVQSLDFKLKLSGTPTNNKIVWKKGKIISVISNFFLGKK